MMQVARFRALITAVLMAALAVTLFAQGDAEVLQGLAIAPVELNLQGLNRALVGRGSYIVNGAGICTRCHTPGARYLADGNPFLGQTEKPNTAGYLGGGNVIGGVTVRNLTPDAQGRPGGLTLEEFIFTMRTGTDLKNLAPFPTAPATVDLLQVMPWPDFQKLTDTDLRAIYEYLKAIPCLPNGPGLTSTRCL
jgi:hypothetical protein